MEEIKEKIRNAEESIRQYGRVIVGYSGGVDSTLAAFLAHRVLGMDALIVLARTETITEEDVELARTIAREQMFRYREIGYNELDIDLYAANPVNRCYFCKRELYVRLKQIGLSEHITAIIDGANKDDLGDYRPGRTAAKELGIHSPLIDASMTKEDVRAAAKLFGLPNADKPAAPCLSSRIPYGIQIDRKSLEQIARAEKFIRNKGFTNVRVRHFRTTAKIEVDVSSIQRLKQMNEEVQTHLKSLGYTEVLVDEEGFKSGNLNKGIVRE